MLTTYLSGLVDENITKLVNLRGEVEDNDGPIPFNILSVQTAGGAVIVPAFYEENDILDLMLNEDGGLSSNVGDYVNNAEIKRVLGVEGYTFKNCGEDTETTVVSSLLAQMTNEKLESIEV